MVVRSVRAFQVSLFCPSATLLSSDGDRGQKSGEGGGRLPGSPGFHNCKIFFELIPFFFSFTSGWRLCWFEDGGDGG
ncbi:hypothetical protein NC652_041160 [Populus alba x Populus x berolinensis]|nr:hypothetical protein NC652_041160 [Populus alba x Populus x berolinensis]